MPATVSSVTCSTYDEQAIDSSVRSAIDLLGGIESFVSPGMTVFLKPNLLAGVDPARAVTTHPAVTRAVARLLTDYGCRVVIGDSPGAGIRYTAASLQRVYTRSGIASLAAMPGVSLNMDISHTTVPSRDGRVVKRFLALSPAVAADAIISLSKPKTHLLTTYTGAVKNIFGIVPGHEKSLFHTRFPEAPGFSEMLIDLTTAVVPVLHLMDGVVGMEGNGPMAGTPRDLGYIFASRNPHALDRLVCRTIGIAEDLVPTIQAAGARGLLDDDLVVVGDNPDSGAIRPFRLPDTQRPAGLRMKIARKILARAQKSCIVLAPRPVVEQTVCTGCGACQRICPAGVITLEERKAAIDLSRCIRCYCCHESCEDAAIQIKDSCIYRFLFGRRQ